jgi:hypothetical protein
MDIIALRTKLINHIMHIKQFDPDYARWRLMEWHREMPWLDLVEGVREAMK